MQPLPPAGSSGPYLSNLSAPATPGGANRSAPAQRQDGVELNSNRQPPLMQRPPGEARSRLEPSPRPWPPAAEHQPRTTALAALASRGQPATACQALPGGALNAALFGQLSGPADPWRATPTPSGWTVPRNPDRRPLEARDPFEVLEGCQDLPELRLVPSCWGNIEALWLQWPEEVLDPAWSAQVAVFHDLFTRMPEQVRFEVVAEGLAEARLRAQMSQWAVARPERVRIHTLALRSSESLLYEPLTLWARDGAVLAESLGKPVLLLPRSFRGHGQVDPKLNRQIVQGTAVAPARLAQALQLEVRRTTLSFEGGDVVAGTRAVLLGAHSLSRTMSERRLSRQAALEEFSHQFGLPVVVIEPQPEFHIDLGFTFLDERTVAVADPGNSLSLLAERPELEAQRKVTLERQLPQRYDQAARQLEEQGFRVVRLPHLAGLSLSTPHCTYNNVLLENDGAKLRRVYLPIYDVPPLDDWARATYQGQDFQVVDMPSARLSTLLWGSLRCASGDLERTRPSQAP